MPPRKLYISYGFLGGKLASLIYKPHLATRNLILVHDPHVADIILAHSAGCWRLPHDVHPALILLVGMPLQNQELRKSFAVATRQNRVGFRQHKHVMRGIRIFGISLLYGIIQPRRNYQILKQLQKFQPFPVFNPTTTVMFIANQNDPYPNSPEITDVVASQLNISFMSMQGTHQDIWEYPERYLALLQL